MEHNKTLSIKMNKVAFLTVYAVLSAIALGGCTDSVPSNKGQAPSAQEKNIRSSALVTPEIVDSRTTGFIVGNSLAPSTIVVFYDMQCPHCGHLWQAVQELIAEGKTLPVNFKWVPVGVLNKASVSQGATILGAKDPVALMTEHENSLLNRTGGISGDSASLDKFEKTIELNTTVFNDSQSDDHRGVPMIIGRSVATKETKINIGSLDKAGLKTLLGL